MWEPFPGHDVMSRSRLSQTARLPLSHVFPFASFFSSVAHILGTPQDNVAITNNTHTHIWVSRLTFQLFECDLVSNRGLPYSAPFPPFFLQPVLMRLGVCLLPACCFHCFFSFFPSSALPAPLSQPRQCPAEAALVGRTSAEC